MPHLPLSLRRHFYHKYESSNLLAPNSHPIMADWCSPNILTITAGFNSLVLPMANDRWPGYAVQIAKFRRLQWIMP